MNREQKIAWLILEGYSAWRADAVPGDQYTFSQDGVRGWFYFIDDNTCNPLLIRTNEYVNAWEKVPDDELDGFFEWVNT